MHKYGDCSFCGGEVKYEPDKSTPADASKVPDYVTFCQDGHVNAVDKGAETLSAINWVTTGRESGGDKHGKNGATGDITIRSPYSGTNCGDYVLSCTDCHEPHGSPNVMLIRRRVNGGTVSVE